MKHASEVVDWAVERWNTEVKNRPLRNIHRRSLDGTWRQVIRRFGGDDLSLVGPRHDELVALEPSRTGERPNLRKELEKLINGLGLEIGSNTPDFMLADYLADCLHNFDRAVSAREQWYGRGPGLGLGEQPSGGPNPLAV